MALRNYQQEAVNSLFKFWEKSAKPCIISASTGSGKSWIAAEIVNRAEVPTLILQPTKEILEQNYEKLLLTGVDPKSVFVCSASAGSWKIGKITLATIGTIYKHADYCQHFKVIVVDEADVVPSERSDSQYLKFFSQLPKTTKIVGLTACVDGETEVLTPTGFVRFDKLEGERGVFAQWTPPSEGSLGKITFEEASIFRGWADHMNSSVWEKEGTEFLFTDGHTIPIEFHKYNGEIYHKDEKSGNVKWNGRKRMYVAGEGAGKSRVLTNDEKLGIFLQADGSHKKVMEKGRRKGLHKHQFSVKKQHKVDRIKSYSGGICRWQPDGVFTGEFYLPFNAKKLSNFIKLPELSSEKARAIIEEMSYYDGHKYKDGSFEYYSTDSDNIDIMQAVACLGGYMSRKATIPPSTPNRKQSYKLYIRPRPTRTTSSLTNERRVEWNKPVYCLHTKTGYFVARKNGRIFITGNTPWRNQTFSAQFEDPKVYCRPLTRIFCRGGDKEWYGKWFWNGGVIYNISIPYLQEHGFLSKTVYHMAETDWSFVRNVPGRVDFDTNGMERWCDIESNTSRFTQAVQWCMDNNLKTIIFSPNIDMNFRLRNVVYSLGGKADTMDSDHDSKSSREMKMDRFRRGGFQFLINVGMVGRGVDVPSVDAIILARPTKSLSLYCQFIGRALRIDPNNPDKVAQVLDLAGNVDRFGKVEDVKLEKQPTTTPSGWTYDKDIITIVKKGRKRVWEKVS